MTTALRRDPRRPYVMTGAGIRRIVLGPPGPAVSPSATSAASAGALSGPNFGALGPAATSPSKPLRTNEAPRDFLLVLVYSERGVLDQHARQVIAGAALIATARTAVVLGVLGELTEDAAECGADIVVKLPDCDSRRFRPEHALAWVAALIEQFSPKHVLLPDRAQGEGDLGRRLAAACGASIATQVVELGPDHVAAFQTSPAVVGSPRLAVRSLPDFVLLAPDAVDSRLPFVGRGERIDIPAIAETVSIYRDQGVRLLDASELPLEEADFIAAAGNGVTDVDLFERLARALGAATGASRVAVDDGRFAREKQIGATGKTVSANVYMAIGISGAVQHLQGIKDCRHVIAVNRDAAAPITQRADLTLIDDAQSLMQALLDAVQTARAEARSDPANGRLTNADTEQAA